MAETTTVSIDNVEQFKQQALVWANAFNVVCLLDSNGYSSDKYSSCEWVLAVDELSKDLTYGQEKSAQSFSELNKQVIAGKHLFGFFTYDLKNELESLSSNHADNIGFPAMYFFEPRFLFELRGSKLTVNRNYPETFELIEVISKCKPTDVYSATARLRCNVSKNEYVSKVQAIRQQIEEGDFYELNYCINFSAENVELNTWQTFLKLNECAKAPFSCYVKWHDRYLMCASPERFLKKSGRTLIAQPIKGTNRKAGTKQLNELQREALRNSNKEQAENVMIVDLVRNDLSKSAISGTVHVEELFGIYTFETVNQMISTVSAQLSSDVEPVEAIKNAFPMGSMTGAPKVEVMKNIERYENFKRGLYSGSVGYFKNGDFDFNVVIRSILYNQSTRTINVPVGGAITYDSVPEQEYEEVLLKAQAMFSVLGAELLINN